MGLGQTLLTIMALILMGRVILTMNTVTLDTGFSKDMAEYRITGTSLGISMLEKANQLFYDENSILASISSVSSFSNVPLGYDSGESNESLYDDVDDYNGFIKYDTLANSAIFKTTVKVEYAVVSGGSIVTTNAKAYSKLLTVYITSDFLVDYSVNPPRPDTLKFMSLFSYWYFR
ncbi:MAG: hypothetical protein H3C35_12050 [Bacteroidetes bacterium]|nr:hypothetical protein [Bacteroidota bacterium]